MGQGFVDDDDDDDLSDICLALINNPPTCHLYMNVVILEALMFERE